MVMNITELEKAISNKEGFMALAHTRLGNRAQRAGAELCRDLVETQLVDESRQIRLNTSILQQTLAEVCLFSFPNLYIIETLYVYS